MAKSKTQQTFQLSARVVDAYTGNGKRGEFHTLTVVHNGREMSLFSDVSAVDVVDQDVLLEAYLKPSFDGKAQVQVAGVVTV